MNSPLLGTETNALLAIRNEKELLRKQIRLSGRRISSNLHEVLAPVPRATTRAQGFGQMVSHGLAIYEGVRMGVGFIRAFRGLFGKTKRFRR